MPDLGVRGRVLREKFAGFDARSNEIAKTTQKIANLREQREEMKGRREPESAFTSIENEILELVNQVNDEGEKLFNDMLSINLRNGGKGLFIDSMIKFCKAAPADIFTLSPIEAVNKLYREQGDFVGITKLMESDERFVSPLTSPQYISGMDTDVLHEVVKYGLRLQTAGKENIIFKNTFGTFYNTVALCDRIGRDNNFLKSIYHDESISKQYKDQLKRAVQNFKFNHTDAITAGEKAKLIAGAVASAPGLLISGAGAVAKGALKLCSGVVGITTGLVAAPTQLASQALFGVGSETDNTAGKAAAYTGGTIFAIPAAAIKLAGGLASGALSASGAIVGKTMSLISYPLTYPLRAAAYSCVGTLPKVSKSQKIITKNIKNLILETNPGAKLDDLGIYCSYNNKDRKLEVIGKAEEQEYKFDFDVGNTDAAMKIKNMLEEDYEILSFKDEMDKILQDEDDDELKKLLSKPDNSLAKRQQAKVISEITSQRPVETAIHLNSQKEDTENDFFN